MFNNRNLITDEKGLKSLNQGLLFLEQLNVLALNFERFHLKKFNLLLKMLQATKFVLEAQR